jgi:hypothetical protein
MISDCLSARNGWNYIPLSERRVQIPTGQASSMFPWLQLLIAIPAHLGLRSVQGGPHIPGNYLCVTTALDRSQPKTNTRLSSVSWLLLLKECHSQRIGRRLRAEDFSVGAVPKYVGGRGDFLRQIGVGAVPAASGPQLRMSFRSVYVHTCIRVLSTNDVWPTAGVQVTDCDPRGLSLDNKARRGPSFITPLRAGCTRTARRSLTSFQMPRSRSLVISASTGRICSVLYSIVQT